MVGQVLDINDLLGPTRDSIALAISNKYIQYDVPEYLSTQNAELRNYLFDGTTTTSNKSRGKLNDYP
jgi:hypothetical protein